MFKLRVRKVEDGTCIEEVIACGELRWCGLTRSRRLMIGIVLDGDETPDPDDPTKSFLRDILMTKEVSPSALEALGRDWALGDKIEVCMDTARHSLQDLLKTETWLKEDLCVGTAVIKAM